MVGTIRASNVGPTAEIAKLAEALLAVALFLAIGPLVGLALGALAPRYHARLGWLGAAVGAMLFGITCTALASLGQPSAGGIVACAVVLIGWGTLLGLTVRAASRHPAEQTLGRSRRRFLEAVASAAVAVAALAFGLERWLRSARLGAANTEAATTEAPSPAEQDP